MLVHINGSRYWRLKYRFFGKEKLQALGIYPEVSLADARECRTQARKIVAAGNDPFQVKQETKRQAILKSENSFEAIAREWHKSRDNAWTKLHATNLMRRLEVDIFPRLGNRPIADITPPELLSVIRVIEKRDALDLAQRMMQTYGQIFMCAIATGHAARNPTADLKGALKVPSRKHYAHLKEAKLPEFLQKLETYDGNVQTKLALKLLILTFVRTTELRGVEWKEINFDAAEWRIPAERMKMRGLHIVPLAKQTVEILRELQKGLTPNKIL